MIGSWPVALEKPSDREESAIGGWLGGCIGGGRQRVRDEPPSLRNGVHPAFLGQQAKPSTDGRPCDPVPLYELGFARQHPSGLPVPALDLRTQNLGQLPVRGQRRTMIDLSVRVHRVDAKQGR